MKKVMVKNNLYILIFILCNTIIYGQSTIAKGFYDEEISGNLNLPVGIVFDQEGNGFLWEKAGIVYRFDNSNGNLTSIIDISEEVGSWGDHGLSGFALDPEYTDNGYVYLAYTVDRYHLFNFGKDDYNPDSTILKNATIGRVSRFTLDLSQNPVRLIPDSKKILIGKDLQDGFPILADFHGVGSIAFGNDGSLFVGCGDSGLDSEPGQTYHTAQAVEDGIIDSTMVIGSYRAQSLYSLNGKLIRVNKYTGDGISSNPFFDPENPRSAPSRIWALGLRNPFKFTHIPGTGLHNEELGDPGTFIVGDVGSSYWEELNLLDSKGTNFGWPVYEGHHNAWPYGFYYTKNPHAPIQDKDEDCEREFYQFDELILQENANDEYFFMNPCNDTVGIPETYPQFVHHRPFLYYNNISWNQPKRSFVPAFDSNGKAIEINTDSIGLSPGIEGYSIIPGAWYNNGTLPDSLNHSLIASDFSGWIKFFKFNEDFQLVDIIDFRSEVTGIVSVSLNPVDDCLYYVNINSGTLHKICFGGNPPPVAIAQADTIYGNNELTVQFDAQESYDPNQLEIKYYWEFGDGTVSNEVNPKHVYQTERNDPVKYIAYLTVTDNLGAASTDSIFISLNNSPPEVKITSPNPNMEYAINAYNRLDLAATVTDLEENNDALEFEWQIHLHHNAHYHSEEPVHQEKYSSILEPVGCGETDIFWYRISLNVTDSYGLEGNDEVLIYPNCEEYKNIHWKRIESNGNDLILNWEIEDSEDILKVVVQRIDDAGNITDLGSSTQYTFNDQNPNLGSNRYRLKVFNNPYKYYYSTEITVDFPLTKDLHIYPNPNPSSLFNINVNQHLNEPVEIYIYSTDGIKIYHQKWTEFNSRNLNLEVDLGDLPAGTYIVFVQNGDRTLYDRIQILR